MPDDIKKIAELEGVVTDLEAQIGALKKKITEGGNDDVAIELGGKIEALTKALSDLNTARTAEKADLVKRAEVAEAVAKLSPKHRAHFDSLSKKEDKEKFLAMKDEEKEEEAEKVKKADESVTIEGQVIRKSAVGAEVFSVMKAQAERIAKGEKETAELRKKNEDAAFEKKADAEFKHIPGTLVERGAMLGAVEKMEPELKKAFEAVFMSAEKLASAGFGKVGHGGGNPQEQNAGIQKSVQDFDTKVSEVAARDKISKAKAMGVARKEYPDLFKAYQEAGGQGVDVKGN